MSQTTLVEAELSPLEEALDTPMLNLSFWKDKVVGLVQSAKDDILRKQIDKKLAHQVKCIADIWRATRFDGRPMSKSKRDIAYRKAQITTIGEMVKNQESRRLAQELNEITQQVTEILYYVALGLIKAI